jgi:hypothetical protein
MHKPIERTSSNGLSPSSTFSSGTSRASVHNLRSKSSESVASASGLAHLEEVQMK